jgi:hypothetical protein
MNMYLCTYSSFVHSKVVMPIEALAKWNAWPDVVAKWSVIVSALGTEDPGSNPGF